MESLLFAREESSIKNRAEELRDHLLNFPASKMIAVEVRNYQIPIHVIRFTRFPPENFGIVARKNYAFVA